MSLTWWLLEFKLICNMSYCYKYVLYVVVERQILHVWKKQISLWCCCSEVLMSSNSHQKYVYTVCF